MIQILLIAFLLFWAVVLILPSVLGEQFLKDYGIQISVFTISFEYTLTTQRKMKSISSFLRSSCRGVVNTSLILGTAFMFLGMLLSSLYILIYFGDATYILVSHNLQAALSLAKTQPLIVPEMSILLPGINFPMSHVPILFIILFIVFGLHEAGHLVAALHEGLEIKGVGFTLVGLLPAAFVRIDDTIERLPAWNQLKVISAGVLVNFLLTAVCIGVKYTLPKRFILLSSICLFTAYTSLCCGLFNTMPIVGVDGGLALEHVVALLLWKSDKGKIKKLVKYPILIFSAMTSVCIIFSVWKQLA